MSRSMAVFLLFAVAIIHLSSCYVESVAASVSDKKEPEETFSQSEFHPMVAFKCGYRNQYLDTHGKWATDSERYATCLTGKLDILKYCRKSYPDLEVTNIVEDTHFHKISEWCKEEGTPCKWTHNIRPFRCIVGEFQSEALLVPQQCRFGHRDDRQVCETFQHWEEEAKTECGKREGGMVTKSFALLAPCGLDMYSGVEFVCCPPEKSTTQQSVESTTVKVVDLGVKVKLEDKKDEEDDSEEDDEYYDDDEDDDEDDYSYEDEKDNSANEAKSGEATEDVYFRIADPENEHENYREAMKRVEEKHRSKVAKVMREWSELESRYQSMKTKDPRHAEDFKKEMTERFQKTVAALEDENQEERRQLDEVHQERVQATLNERKRETIKAYREALAMSLDASQPHKVLKTLQAYIRSEEKDRTHNLNRYRHLLRNEPAAAEELRPKLTTRLHDIDLRVNGTIAMLHDLPSLEEKIKPTIIEFWKAFRKENTPALNDDSVVGIAKGMIGPLLDQMRTTYEPKRQQDPSLIVQEPIQVKIEEARLEDETHENERIVDEYEARPVYNRERERAFHQAEVHESSEGGGHTLLIFGVAGGALLVTLLIGVLLVRRKPHYDLVPRDLPTSPEEKMMAAMQVNGYENPTYHFFEKA